MRKVQYDESNQDQIGWYNQCRFAQSFERIGSFFVIRHINQSTQSMPNQNANDGQHWKQETELFVFRK